MLLINQGCCLYSKSTFQLCASRKFCVESKTVKSDPLHPSGRPCQLSWRSSIKQHPFGLPSMSKQAVQGYIRSDVSATRPDAIQCSTSKRISLADTNMGSQLQPSRRQFYSIRTLSLIRQDVEQICNYLDASSYYENCVQQKCNNPDARATSSWHGPFQERISVILESRLYGWPSRHSQLPSRCCLEKIDSNSIKVICSL
jgi:hypothetical protein